MEPGTQDVQPEAAPPAPNAVYQVTRIDLAGEGGGEHQYTSERMSADEAIRFISEGATAP